MFGESKKSKLAAALEVGRLAKEIETALKPVERVMDERTKIRAAIKATEQAVLRAEEEFKTALQALNGEEAARALEEAAVALGETATVVTPRKARKLVSAARDELETLEARLTGLRARLTATEGDLLTAADEFAVARQTFIQTVLDEFREQYRKAGEEFAETLRLGYGLAQGLGVRLSGLRSIKLVDPQNDGKELVPLFDRERTEGAGWQEQWLENATARAAFESVSRIKAVAQSLERDVSEVRKRREEQAMRDAWAKAEMQPKAPVLRFAGAEAGGQDQHPSVESARPLGPAEEVRAGREAIERLAGGGL